MSSSPLNIERPAFEEELRPFIGEKPLPYASSHPPATHNTQHVLDIVTKSSYETPVIRLGMDIGGSLAKVVVTGPGPTPFTRHLKFTKFMTRNIGDLLRWVVVQDWYPSVQSVECTGGGAHKFEHLIVEALKMPIIKHDEMKSLVCGVDFLLTCVEDPVFEFTPDVKLGYARKVAVDPTTTYPFILCSVGSGVSIIRVDGPHQYERVGGSAIGGGTFAGLMRALTGVTDFEEMLDLSCNGDHRTVDMLVGDIYGGAIEDIGLNENVIASSFGKIGVLPSQEHGRPRAISNRREADIAAALLTMVSNNISQIAFLAAEKCNAQNVCFAGHFIHNHPLTMEKITFGIDFWSKKTMNALFLRHEGYLGTIGTLACAAEREEQKKENVSTTELEKYEYSDDEITGKMDDL